CSFCIRMAVDRSNLTGPSVGDLACLGFVPPAAPCPADFGPAQLLKASATRKVVVVVPIWQHSLLGQIVPPATHRLQRNSTVRMLGNRVPDDGVQVVGVLPVYNSVLSSRPMPLAILVGPHTHVDLHRGQTRLDEVV